MTERLVAHFALDNTEALLRKLGVDLRYVMGPSFMGQQMRVQQDGLVQDHWGVLRKPMTVQGTDRTARSWTWTYQHVHSSPLQAATSTDQIEDYPHWPTADLW